MPELYLTPSSISYLTLFLLTLITTVYLVSRTIGREKKMLWRDAPLVWTFASLTLLAFFFFLENSFLPAERYIVVCLENTVLAILLAALIQFAYNFPIPNENYKTERWIALFLSGVYIFLELRFAVYRFTFLQDGHVAYRHPNLDMMVVVEFAWIIFVFARNSIRNWKLPAVRNFALILLIPLALAILNYLWASSNANPSFYNVGITVGILFATFLFVLNYLSSQPEQTSFVIKMSGAALTSVLAVFGTIAWLVTPIHAEYYETSVRGLDHRTIHFNPDGNSGYVISEIPFLWEHDFGEKVKFPDQSSVLATPYDFEFPFLGQRYQHILIGSHGSIGMGEQLRDSDYQYHFTSTPLMFPLLTNLMGDVYVRQADEKLIVTWYHLQSAFREDTYTFQAVLFSDGSFNFTYNGLPKMEFRANDPPAATVWAIGIKPVQAPLGTANFTNLPMQIGPQGALQDEYRSFRIYQNKFLVPLAHAVVGSSLIFLIGAMLILNYGLARPLEALLESVQNFNKGRRETIPVQSNDEIGYLTESFNTLGGELNSLIHGLEQRVAERTLELAATNEQLRSEMIAHTEAQAQVTEQQRAVAALEERERLARELHDGIGQVLGFLNVQGQSAIDLVNAGDKRIAAELLTRMVEVAQEAHDDVRGYILGLKQESSAQPRQNFFDQLEQYCQHLAQNFGFQVRLNLPAEIPSALAGNAVETQLLYVIREALSNARSHSGQNEAEVTVTFDATLVQAVIQDHGVGFSEGKQGHFGLGIMRERAEGLGGSIEIDSAPGSGTRVTVCLPRKLNAESTPGRRVLLVDDHPLFLEGMVNLITSRGMVVVGTANDGLDALEKARELHPNVILMDIEMPRCDGLEATRLIKAEMPEVKVVMLTVSGEERHLFEALLSGASGYLLKSLDAAELTSLLEELLRGEISISPSLANKMLEAFTRHKAPPANTPGVHPPKEPEPAYLNDRQMETLRLVARGMSYKVAAELLGVTEVTIKYRMGEILTRLHLNSKREAVRYFQEGKLKQ
jgi:DNA-binding NarL/FixJ family response regulator/signal transduction histidine kinase